MTTFHPDYAKNLMRNWDRIWATPECPYCHGTGKADTHNECGFCETEQDLDATKRKG